MTHGERLNGVGEGKPSLLDRIVWEQIGTVRREMKLGRR
jgi:hypothetical protein